MIVYVNGDNIESAIKTLKRAVAKDGILRALKIRSRFESRTQRRKRKAAEAQRRRKRRLMRGEQFVSYKKTQQDFQRERREAEKQRVASTASLEVNEVRQENGE